MDGTGGTLWGGTSDTGRVEADVCMDLSGANSFSGAYYNCDGNCLNADGDAVSCWI